MSLEFVIVRTSNESKRTPPKTFMTRDSAQELYEAGLATWNDKKTALTLKKRGPEMYHPALSLLMSAMVMHAACEGDKRSMAMRDAWKFSERIIYVEDIEAIDPHVTFTVAA